MAQYIVVGTCFSDATGANNCESRSLLTSPYSVYVNKRPLRVAFLVADKPESLSTIDSILAYNRGRWGGRHNPIILTDGHTLTEAWWSLLEVMDPDVIKSFVNLDDDLIAHIDKRISPILIQQPAAQELQEGVRHIRLFMEGLSILPTAGQVRAASGAWDEPTLVLFDTDKKETSKLVKRFVEWNFGGYPSPIYAVSKALQGVRTRTYSVTDVTSLITPLRELSTSTDVTYPIQLASAPNDALPPVQYDRFGDAPHVVIGDTPADITYFWNRSVAIPQWRRGRLCQVWLPIDLALDPQLSAPLCTWLQWAAGQTASSQPRIRFVSLSLPEDRLREIAEPIARGMSFLPTIEALSGFQPPQLRTLAPGPDGLDQMDLYRANAQIERLTLMEPGIPQGHMHGEHWMADIYMEFHPERHPQVSGRPLWWQFPRVNELAWRTFRCPARILRTRYPSLAMKHGEPRLDITVLDDLSVFATLIAAHNGPSYTIDARYEKGISLRKSYYGARRSEKGRYLSGLLELFNGLYTASRTLEERYWRRIFDMLSGRPDGRELASRERVYNKLKKALRQNSARFYENDESIDWMTRYVLNLARTLPKSIQELEFRVFADEAKKEMEAFNASRVGQEPWDYSEDDLLNAVADLTDLGVLLMGIPARCTSCGYREWRHIDHITQSLQCKGCNAIFPLSPEKRWHYRLNSLARASLSEHGLLPVVLVLGQLFMEARNAFIFAPCLDLFEKKSERPIGDLDIAVILDGRFVIGEIKQSRDLFDEATFTKMEDIARRLLPDVLLFGSMDREPSKFIAQSIARLSCNLRPHQIDVRWYPLDEYKFAPSPVR